MEHTDNAWRETMPKAVAVVGTNASGKSDLGVSLALRFAGEIISADSRQVYKGLDIGTGKLSPAEMRGVPHHMINVMTLDTRFSLADFQQQVYRLMDEIRKRGRLPFIVGGTGLYIRAVVQGYQLVPAKPNPMLRQQLEQLSNMELHQALERLSPEAAGLIDFRNRRRIIRAIEVGEQGFPYKAMHVNAPKYHFLQLGLTWPRDILRSRIEARLRRRLDTGMIDEVRTLVDDGVSFNTLEALGLEYRYIGRFLQGEYSDEGQLSSELSRAIYRFATRQLSWFRRDRAIIWLDSSGDYTAEAIHLISDFLEAA